MVIIRISILKGMNLKGMMREKIKGSTMLLQLTLMNHIIRGGLGRNILMMNIHSILLLQVPLHVMMKFGWWAVVPLGT